MPPAPKIAEVQKDIDRLSQASGTVDDFMWELVKLLHDRMLKYNWVGFYMLEEKTVDSQPRMLALGPFQGAMTPHTRIPLNQGICGQPRPPAKRLLWTMSASTAVTWHALPKPNPKSWFLCLFAARWSASWT